MITRMLYTKIWHDHYFSRLNAQGKLLFLYLLTNPNVNLCGVYELPDRIILSDTGMGKQTFEVLKDTFGRDGKFFFYEGWVCVANYDKYNGFYSGKNDIARQHQLEGVPVSVKKYFEDRPSIDHRSTIDGPSISISTSTSTKHIKTKDTNTEIETIAREYLDYFNFVFDRNYAATGPLLPNIRYWVEQGYTIDDFRAGIDGAKEDNWWADKAEPVRLLRRANTKGEPVDYIGQLKERHKSQERKLKRFRPDGTEVVDDSSNAE